MFKLFKEFFWTMFWIFVVLIVGFFVLNWVSTLNIPVLSGIASWSEQHAQAQG